MTKLTQIWQPTIQACSRDIERILSGAEQFGSDPVSGGRAAVIEAWFENLRKQINDLDDELRFHHLRFEPVELKKVDKTKYVVCRRDNRLYFLLGQASGEEGDGHLLIVERHGFKSENCLGGGFATIDPSDWKVELSGASTSLGPNRVHEKTVSMLLAAISELESD